eukprot:106178-Chlamydomonas_euryale.AAC.2
MRNAACQRSSLMCALAHQEGVLTHPGRAPEGAAGQWLGYLPRVLRTKPLTSAAASYLVTLGHTCTAYVDSERAPHRECASDRKSKLRP